MVYKADNNSRASMCMMYKANDNSPASMCMMYTADDNSPASMCMMYKADDNSPASMCMIYKANDNSPASMCMMYKANDNSPASMCMMYTANDNSPASMSLMYTANDNSPVGLHALGYIKRQTVKDQQIWSVNVHEKNQPSKLDQLLLSITKDTAVIAIIYTVQQVAVHSDFITPQHQPLSMVHPHRTPKEGVRRGPDPGPDGGERILGTPDYLAPEILRQEKHGTTSKRLTIESMPHYAFDAALLSDN